MTMEVCAEIDKALKAMICKNLFLCNRQETNFYLLMIPADKKFKTKDLSAQLGVSRLSFGKEEYMEKFLPDAVILDLELHQGGGDGLFFLAQLQQLELSKHPYILVTTNNSSNITYESARQLGADFILAKYQENYSAQYVVEFLRIMKKVIFSEKGKTASKITATEPSESKDKRLIQKIQHELNLIGISPKVVGYRYLTDAILATINEPKTRIFKVLGEKYKKTDASIERAMQNAINRAWRTSDIDDLLTYYTARIHSQKGVPTIMEFIFYYANKIQNQL